MLHLDSSCILGREFLLLVVVVFLTESVVVTFLTESVVVTFLTDFEVVVAFLVENVVYEQSNMGAWFHSVSL